jgi:hypothetical protein
LALPEKDLEHLSVAGQLRTLDLETTDPRVPTIRFTEAQALLADSLGDLPRLEHQEPTHLTRFLAAAPRVAQGFSIALDETEPTGLAMRPLFGAAVRPAAAAVRPTKAAKAPLPTIPVALDAPTVADETGLLPLFAGQRNLPTYIKKGLAAFYKLSVPPAQPPLGPQAPRKSIRKRKERATRA